MTDDHRVVLHAITYQQYVQLANVFEDRGSLRLTYADGTLEILTTGSHHQIKKKTISRLVELHALIRDVPIYSIGNVTLRSPRAKVGLEPDECYSVGKTKRIPDVAIEVVLCRRVNKLSIYQRLGVAEVWVHRRGKLEIHRLVDGAYQSADTSRFFPDLDFRELEEYLAMPDQDAAVRAYWARLSG